MDNPQEIKREKVRVVPIKYIDDFPDHPFKVVDDESMEQLIRSIDLNGVLTPVIARKKKMKDIILQFLELIYTALEIAITISASI